MKINKSRLQRIVQEEIQSILQEAEIEDINRAEAEAAYIGHGDITAGRQIKGSGHLGDPDAIMAVGETPEEMHDFYMLGGPGYGVGAATAPEYYGWPSNRYPSAEPVTDPLPGFPKGGGPARNLREIIQEELQSILAEEHTKGLSIGDEELRFAQMVQYKLDHAIKAYNYWGQRIPPEFHTTEWDDSRTPGWYSPEFNAAAAAVKQFRDELRDLGVNPGSVTGQRDPTYWGDEDPRSRQRPRGGSGPPVIYDKEDVRGHHHIDHDDHDDHELRHPGPEGG